SGLLVAPSDWRRGTAHRGGHRPARRSGLGADAKERCEWSVSSDATGSVPASAAAAELAAPEWTGGSVALGCSLGLSGRRSVPTPRVGSPSATVASGPWRAERPGCAVRGAE